MSDPTLASPRGDDSSLSSKFEVWLEIASLSSTLGYGDKGEASRPVSSHPPSAHTSRPDETKPWYAAEHKRLTLDKAAPTKVPYPLCVVVRYGSVVWRAKVSHYTYVYYLKRAIAYRFAPHLGPSALQINFDGRKLKDCEQMRDAGIEHGDEVDCFLDFGQMALSG